MLSKEQFVKAMETYCKINKCNWETWDIHSEWERYKKGRSWCNEFFNTEKGAKYVA